MRFLICLILLGLSLTSKANPSEDFFILKPGELKFIRTPGQQFSPLAQTTCRDRIRQIMCLVKSTQNPVGTRQCLPGSESFADPVEKIYDILPEKVQKAFCGLDVIYVEEDMEALAYAGIVRQDPTKGVVGSFMGIRKILLEQAYDATSVFGWKEQKAFGIKAPPFVHMPEGPRVEVALPGSLSALQYVMIHEFGHIIDFSNKANDFVCPAGETCKLETGDMAEYQKLVPVPNSWSALSWKNAVTPKDNYHFPLWDNLCFYGCNKSLSVADVEQFYRELAPTNFVTTYAAVSPFEDFAESFTFHVLSLQGDWSYQIQTPQTAYSLDQKWKNTWDKKSWMESFYNQDLRYPTPSN
ncbi:hypothetical protein [Bdellovibrio sp. HCB-162]|uniref:hypothetical protein n=1 Tax=Bdellovibrio sp. HCB-162 TaxID=3394234 RepID=UPI0039BCDBCB